jgi:hypothetical protein
MYRKRFTNRRSRRKYDALDREVEARRAIMRLYLSVDPAQCDHSGTLVLDMVEQGFAGIHGKRTCERCGVETDSQHIVIGVGDSNITDAKLAEVQQIQRERIAAHRAMLDACSVESDSSTSQD